MDKNKSFDKNYRSFANKLFIVLIMLSVCIISVHASAYDSGKRGISVPGASAKGPAAWPNLLEPVRDAAISSLSLGWADNAQGDWQQGLFYPIKSWEMEVCQAGVESDLTADSSIDKFGASTDLSKIYGPLTATLQAQKYPYSANESLYEIAWYIQPKDSNIKYSIYLVYGKKKYYIANAQNLVADPVQGDAGFYAEYTDGNFTNAIMEEIGSGTSRTVILNTTIAINPYGARYS